MARFKNYYMDVNGNDVLVYKRGDNITLTGDNDDYLIATNYRKIYNGSSGDNYKDGGNGADAILGNDGNDTLKGGSGSDVVLGGGGDDTLIYEMQINNNSKWLDFYKGGDGNDTLEIDLRGTDVPSGYSSLQDYANAITNYFNTATVNNGLADFRDMSGASFNLVARHFENIHVITSDNENAPVITSANAASVDENSTKVLTVTATDADPSDTPTFNISGGADQALFSINAITGELSFNNPPDHEAPADAGADNIYEVEISASDGVNNSAPQLISVSVQNADALFDGAANVVNFNDANMAARIQETIAEGGSPYNAQDGNDLITLPDIAPEGFDPSQTFSGGDGSDTIYGGSGDDIVDGGSGSDTIYGGAGDDIVDGGSGNDYFIGGAGDDSFTGGSGWDRAHFFESNLSDAIITVNTNDWTITVNNTASSDGTDILDLSDTSDAFSEVEFMDFWGDSKSIEMRTGTDGDNNIYMTNSPNISGIIIGLDGNDLLHGGMNGDSLYGGNGADTLTGANGDDVMTGGLGDDLFVYSQAGSIGHGSDTVTDFNANGDQDQIDLTLFGTNITDLLLNSQNVGGDAVIDLGAISGNANDQLTLIGVDVADLDAGDFMF